MFQVEWVQSALDQLAAIWIDAESPARDAVTSAVNQIDQFLAVDPAAHGESREQSRRTMFVASLGIDFHIDLDDRRVVILRVWLVRKRKT